MHSTDHKENRFFDRMISYVVIIHKTGLKFNMFYVQNYDSIFITIHKSILLISKYF